MTIVTKKIFTEHEIFSHCVCDHCKIVFGEKNLFAPSFVTQLSYSWSSDKGTGGKETRHFCSTGCLLAYMRHLRVGSVTVLLTQNDVEILGNLANTV